MQILWRPLGVGFYCRSFAKSPFFLSICSPMANSIYFSLCSKFDICSLCSHSIWICATFSPHRAYRVAKQHIEPKAISSDTKWHISMLKLLFAKTNNSFNVSGMRKQIKAKYFACSVTVFFKTLDIPCKCCGITRNVDYSFWR